ncbi:acetyltransferase [Metabacillus elymi]|uniref:Acetyltransferase n=1 Tax=Metabacillus elymi TaxID=2745198 RepID=A0ABX6S4N8_9BACI|nr:acetyltransferase [Metabacillus sp. KUDC1714]QNF28483.1 acetyltransferase [Metabacillus sp. KUDC1714]
MEKKIIIYGTGGHSKVVMDAIEKSGQYTIYGFIDDYYNDNRVDLQYKYIGDHASLKGIMNNIYGGVIAVGDNWIRSNIVSKIKGDFPSFKFVTVIHPSAVIGGETEIGDGTVIMAGVVVNCHTKIGEHCILNTMSSVDHDCFIDDYVSIAPGATLGGNVCVGSYSAISLGANVIHSKKIGAHSVVGAGATVLNNIDSQVVAYGTPAKVIRYREKGEKYL